MSFGRDAGSVRDSLQRVERALDEAPMEDGITHPAEFALSAHVSTLEEVGLLDAVLHSRSPSRAAEWLRLCGRSVMISAQLCRELATWGLNNEDIEIRSATVKALESWEDRELAYLLLEHNERVIWLRDYAAKVARDLGV